MHEVILISGHLGTGKTSLAKSLKKKFKFSLWESSKTLEVSDKDYSLARKIESKVNKKRKNRTIIIDHIKSFKQLKYIRNIRGLKVTHIHLYASKKVLKKRKEEKLNKTPDLVQSKKNIEALKDDADVRIFTDKANKKDVLVRVIARLGLYSPSEVRCVDVIIGGQYGSEGKGHIAAYLAREYDALVRVGGPNAGHTVLMSEGTYTHHQLPSGCRGLDAKILLGPGMTINKQMLLKEIEDCNLHRESRLFIDPQAMIISEEDKENESGRLKAMISSTASGSGYASARRIIDRSEGNVQFSRDIPEFKKYISPIVEKLEETYKENGKILLEGTQGSGLSIYHGEYPYVTSRDTNVAGCLAEAGISPSKVRKIIMVVRYTPIRVANPEKNNEESEDKTSGNIKHETDWEEIAESATRKIEDEYKRANEKEKLLAELRSTEKTSTTRRDRRVGWFDWELFKKSCAINAPTDIVLSFSDYIDIENRKARRFEQLTDETIKFIEELERVAQAPVSLISTRFPNYKRTKSHDQRAIIDRRNWENSNLEKP